ncbi:UNVERIFIED_CONTAM: hypothetical protein FKN15_013041 [Acipenser sinensis]
MDTASTSSRTGERHSRLIKPGKCNGTSDWETYTTKFQVIAQVNGWTASEKTAHLVAALDGPAEQALLDLPYGQELEFEALCTALQRRFGKRSSELELRDQLYARRREAGEKLGVLDADIEQLACRAFKGVPLELTVQLALDLFIRGLFPSELRRHAHLGHPRCQEMEAILMEESILEPEPSKLQTFLGLRAKGNPRGEAVCAAQPAQPRKPPCCRLDLLSKAKAQLDLGISVLRVCHHCHGARSRPAAWSPRDAGPPTTQPCRIHHRCRAPPRARSSRDHAHSD